LSFLDLPRPTWPELLRFYEETRQKPIYDDPKRLTRSGRKIYSQCDEDGLIAEIFRRIGPKHKTFVEFGVESGLECNSLWLLINGWSGLWIEGEETFANRILTSHAHWINSGKLKVARSFINAENINELIKAGGLSGEIDLLSVDIDLNDYWVWKAIEVVSPRVVCIEYNATWAPPSSLVVKYNAGATWSRTNHFGASLVALTKLGQQKGYSLVGCSLSGANAFFVRTDLCGELFYEPGNTEAHYEPARYFLADLPCGHPFGIAEVEIV